MITTPLMKPIRTITFFTLLIGLTFACEKEDNQTQIDDLSDEEVVALIEGSLVTETEGLATEATDAAYSAEVYSDSSADNLPCGITNDSTVVRAYNSARITANYTSDWEWILMCNNFDIPTSLSWNRSTAGEYESLRLISDDSAESSLTVSNLIAGENFVINGTYSRSGSQNSKVRELNEFTSEINFTVTDLNVTKATQTIASGTANWTLTGTGTGGYSFSRNGSITFLGNGMATVVINGVTYEIDLNG